MTSIKYGVINQKHPDYCEVETKKLEILYEGGTTIEKNAHLFIHKEVARGENDILYNDRIKCISYRNYFAKIINDYVSDLFSKSVAVLPAADASDKNTIGTNISDNFYNDFAQDTDLQGHGLSYVLAKVITEGMISGRAYLGVDFPKLSYAPQNLLEEEQSGALRAYTYCLPTLSVIDWSEDAFGKFDYVVLKTESIPRATFQDRRDKRIIQFKVWERINQTIKYSVYEIAARLNKEPNDKEDCQLVDEGVVSFKEIPVMCMYLPSHLWVGGLIGNLVAEHFKRSSSLVFSMNRSLFSIPVYKQGAELPADGELSELGTDPNRGARTSNQMKLRGFAVIGPQDDISFAEPQGAAYTIVDQQLKELVDTIHQIVSQMGSTVTASSTGVGRSGLSKMMDNHSKELVLSSYANIIKDFATKLYSLISGGRNEAIYWTTKGMDDFQIIDRDQLIKEATQINLISMPTKTWKKHYLADLAFKLAPGIEPETQLVIKKEIDDAIDKMDEKELTETPEEETSETKSEPTKESQTK